jgi:uncharacterized damage-inducible protein DinB
MKSYFIKLLAFNQWANKRVIDFVNESNLKEGEIIKLISHILNAEHVWHVRVTGNKELERDLWSVFQIEELWHQVDDISLLWKNYLEALDEKDFYKEFSYQTSKGEPFTNTFEDIFAHLINHATYHRGQIAKLIRQRGVVPPNTDYINYIRFNK